MPFPPQTPTPERRTQARIRVQIPQTVTVSGRTEPFRAVSQDLSWGGVQLTLSEPLPQAARDTHRLPLETGPIHLGRDPILRHRDGA